MWKDENLGCLPRRRQAARSSSFESSSFRLNISLLSERKQLIFLQAKEQASAVVIARDSAAGWCIELHCHCDVCARS